MAPVNVNGPVESAPRGREPSAGYLPSLQRGLGTTSAGSTSRGPTLPLKVSKRPGTASASSSTLGSLGRPTSPETSLDPGDASVLSGRLPGRTVPAAANGQHTARIGNPSSESTFGHRKGLSDATVNPVSPSSSMWEDSIDAFASHPASDYTSATSPVTLASHRGHPPAPGAHSAPPDRAGGGANPARAWQTPEPRFQPTSQTSRHSSLSSQTQALGSKGLGFAQEDGQMTADSLDFDFGLLSTESPSLDLASTLGASLGTTRGTSLAFSSRSAARSSVQSSSSRGSRSRVQSTQSANGSDNRSDSGDDRSQYSRRDTVTSFSDLLRRSTNRASRRLTVKGDSSATADVAPLEAAPIGTDPSTRPVGMAARLKSRESSASKLSRKPVPLLLDLDISGAGPSMSSPVGESSSDDDREDGEDEAEAATPVAPRRPLPAIRPVDIALDPPPRRSDVSASDVRSLSSAHSRQLSDASSYLSSKDLPPTPTSAYSTDSTASSMRSAQNQFLKRSLSRLKSSRPSPGMLSAPRPSGPYGHQYSTSSSNLSASAGSSFTSLSSSVSSKASGLSRMKRLVAKVKGVGVGSSSWPNAGVGAETPPYQAQAAETPEVQTPRPRRKPSFGNLLGVIGADSRKSPPSSSGISRPMKLSEPHAPTGRRSFDMLRSNLGRRKGDDAPHAVTAGGSAPDIEPRDIPPASSSSQIRPTLRARRSFDVLRGKLAAGRKSMDELSASRPSTSTELDVATTSRPSAKPPVTTPVAVPSRNPANVGVVGPSQLLEATSTPEEAVAPATLATSASVSANQSGLTTAHTLSRHPSAAVISARVEIWDELTAALASSSSPSPAERATHLAVVTNTLLPFLKAEETSRSPDLPDSAVDRPREVLLGWMDWTLDELRQAQPASRGACLEAVASILESHFMSAANLRSAAAQMQYSQALIRVLKFAVEKLNDKAVYANTLVFSGRMLALAFFRIEGVGLKLLQALPAVKRMSLRRLLDEIGAQSAAPKDAGHDRFPPHLDPLRFTGNLLSYCKLFASPAGHESAASLDVDGVLIEMSGNWLIRWTASDSDLPFAFYRAYFRQVVGYLPDPPSDATTSSLLTAPGFLFVAASFLDKCDSLVHRSLRSVTTLGPNSNNFSAGESANLAMGAKPKVLELAHRRLVSTALEIVGGSPRLIEDPERPPADALARKACLSALLSGWIRAITKRTSMWDTRSVFLLLDLLEGLFYTLLYTVPFVAADDQERPPRLDPSALALFDLPFIREVLKRILCSADNTVCVMRTIAFIYSQFEALTARPADRDALCLDLLLEPALFEHLFLHWNSGVRGYYLRLLVWRLSRLGTTENGQASKSPGAVKILLTFNARLDAIRERHDDLSPASDLLGVDGGEEYRLKRSTICSTRGVTDQPWAIDELPRDDTAEVVAEQNSAGGDKAGGSMPKVASWLKVVRRFGTGTIKARSRSELPDHSIQPFETNAPATVPDAAEEGELSIREEPSEAQPAVEAFSTPTRRPRDRASSGGPNSASPTFFKFEFELGADIPRSDAFDSPTTPRPASKDASNGAAEVPIIQTPPPLSRRSSDQGAGALSPRVSTRFSKRASLLPPTALSMLRENPESVPALPGRSRHYSTQDRAQQNHSTSSSPGYPQKKHPYAIRALAEYEQSLEEEHEWKEKVADDEENDGKPLANLCPGPCLLKTVDRDDLQAGSVTRDGIRITSRGTQCKLDSRAQHSEYAGDGADGDGRTASCQSKGTRAEESAALESPSRSRQGPVDVAQNILYAQKPRSKERSLTDSVQGPAPAHASTKESKPSLAGVRNKQRKGVVKAAAKFEPEEFRDTLLKHLSTLPPGDLDAVSVKLEALGNQLDFRKYEGPLFELLLVGALLAPGGSFVEDGAEKSPFSILTSTKTPVETADMKKHVDVFNRLIRRYKYLQKLFEENALTEILQYANKWKGADLDKLTFATALFISTGLAAPNVLLTLKKENLVRDGASLAFITKVFRAYLAVESADHLSSALRRGGLTNISNFFPPQKNEPADVEAHFKAEKLEPILTFIQKQRSGQIRDETLSHLKEMLDAEEPQAEIIGYLKAQFQTGTLPDTDFVAIVWQGLMAAIDMNARPDQIGEAVVKEVSTIAPTLEVFCKSPRTEVALINTIQVWAYENTKVMSSFPRIIKTLYSKDVVSDSAIIFWHAKGSKPQGRQHFLKATDPLVKFLKEQEDEEDDDE